MKRLSVPLGFAAMALTIALPHISQAASKPPNNRYLAAPLYAITHFDSSQSDSTTYGPPKGSYYVDAATAPIAYGGPVKIITLASTDPNYLWQVGSDRVSFVKKSNGGWTTKAS